MAPTNYICTSLVRLSPRAVSLHFERVDGGEVTCSQPAWEIKLCVSITGKLSKEIKLIILYQQLQCSKDKFCTLAIYWYQIAPSS